MTAPAEHLLPRFLDAGECALVVEFGETIDPRLNEAVLALDAALAGTPLSGIVECVPTYRSLMIHYDPLIISRDRLVAHVTTLTGRGGATNRNRRLWTIPACYDDAFGEDLAHVAERQRLSTADVIRLHASARYRVYMYGFAPGVAYLGGLPPELGIPRRTSPRDLVPAQSLIIAGGQAIIMTVAMPSGWHVIGRTPERLFVADRDPAFLVAPGDEITFEAIDRATHERLDREAAAGAVLARSSRLVEQAAAS
jgi:inhibitor of KinA